METGRERYDFYLFLLWPFIEAYWIASVALFGLFSPEGREEADGNVRWVSQAEFLKASQAMGKTLFFQVRPCNSLSFSFFLQTRT